MGAGPIDQKGHVITLQPSHLGFGVDPQDGKWGSGEVPFASGAKFNAFRFGVESSEGIPTDTPLRTPFEILHVDVTFDALRTGQPPMKLIRSPVEKQMNFASKSLYELWVQTEPSPGWGHPDMREGSYQIKIHYRLGRDEYDAEWRCVYKSGLAIRRWPVI